MEVADHQPTGVFTKIHSTQEIIFPRFKFKIHSKRKILKKCRVDTHIFVGFIAYKHLSPKCTWKVTKGIAKMLLGYVENVGILRL